MNTQAFDTDAIAFLEDLNANNNREWFTANKARYDTSLRRPATAFSEQICDHLRDLTGTPYRHKLFRINRDLRFSRDKTPYNTHLHLSFTPDLDRASPPVWMFGLGLDYLTVGCGVFGFDKTGLEHYRSRVAGPEGAAIARTVDDLAAAGFRLPAPELKRVPAPHDADHPRAMLLRRKGLIAWHDFPDRHMVTRPGLVETCLGVYRQLMPIYDLLAD